MIEDTAIVILEKYGIQTLMLLWFMFRTEKVINRNTLALTRIEGVITKCQKKK
jgi:hypothetical protein